MRVLVPLFSVMIFVLVAGCVYPTQNPATVTETGIVPQSTIVDSTPEILTETSLPTIAAAQPTLLDNTPTALAVSSSPTPQPPQLTYEQVDPTNQDVIFWYALPPLSAADIALNQIVDQFNLSNPYQVTINAFNLSTTSAVYEQAFPLLQTDGVPGLIMTSPELVYLLAEGLEDLEPLLASPKWGLDPQERVFSSAQLTALSQLPPYNSALLAVPMSRAALVLVANSDWLIELGYFSPPTSLSELEEIACRAAIQGMRRYPVQNPAGIALSPGLDVLASLVYAQGGTMSHPDYATYFLDSPEMHQTAAYLVNLYQQGCVQIVGNPQDFAEVFTQAQSAMIWTTSDQIAQFARQIDEQFSWEISGGLEQESDLVPLLLPGQNFSLTSKTPSEVLAAWLFVKYFWSSEAQSIWNQASGQLPVTKNSADSELIPEPNQLSEQVLSSARILPVYPLYHEIDELTRQAFQNILSGAPRDEVLKELQQEAIQLSQQFYASQEQ